LTPSFANYGFHPLTEWIKGREAQNPRVKMHKHWMKAVQEGARVMHEQTREEMKKYYAQEARLQANI